MQFVSFCKLTGVGVRCPTSTLEGDLLMGSEASTGQAKVQGRGEHIDGICVTDVMEVHIRA